MFIEMPVRKARAHWEGTFMDGKGTMALGSGAWEGPFGFRSRFEDGPESNPEELIGAAHAGCFSMSLANTLAAADHPPKSIDTTAEVTLEMGDGGPSITQSHLESSVEVPGLDAERFEELVADAKVNCPVSQSLAVDISVEATLE